MSIQNQVSAKPILVSVLSEQTKQSLLPVIRGVVPNVSIKSFKSLNQTIEECIESEESAGTLFIEFGHPLKELTLYLQMIRDQSVNKPDKIILLVDQGDVSEDLISKYLQIGFSGILTKPFSEKSVEEVFKISERLSDMGSIARLKIATGIKIKSMLEQKGKKFQGKSILDSVKAACKVFEKENPGNDLEGLAKKYSRIKPSERINKNVADLYEGPSERVKKMLQEKDTAD